MFRLVKVHLYGLLVLVAALITGMLTYQQYGLNWDDPYQREIGQVSYNYATRGDTTLLTYIYKEYGPAYELFLVTAEQTLHLTDSRDIFLIRHLVNHFLFIAGAWAIYLLAWRLFRNKWLAVLGLLMMLTAPRIYAHSYFNTKDIPFLAGMAISLYLCSIALLDKKWWLFLLAGVFCGFTTSTRIMGIMLVAMVATSLLVNVYTAFRSKQNSGAAAMHLLVFGATFFIAMYSSFPFLWGHPVERFVHCFKVMAHYRWGGTILQHGRFITTEHIPWYVFPLWFAVTNPLLWLALGFSGLAAVLVKLAQKPLLLFTEPERQLQFIYLLCFLTPAAAIVLLHSVIYEDWRHLFFVYPPFVLLALYGLNSLKKRWHKPVAALIAIQVSVTVFTMCRVFPFNQVYFNPLVSHKLEFLRHNYEMDYWGVACKQALDKIMANDHKDVIRLEADRATFCPLENNILLLPADVRGRIQLVGTGQPADYFITDFRTHPQDYPYPNRDYSINAFGSTLIGIYKK